MNNLLVGTDRKTDALLKLTKGRFLFIGDDEVADAFAEHFPKVKQFTLLQHTLNPLRRLDYVAQCNFIDAMMAAFPAGENTLTKEGVPEAFFEEFDRNPKRLDDLFLEKSDNPSYLSAQRMVRRILRSPLLEQTLCYPTNFDFNRSVIVRLDRAELGDFDAFVLATLLIGQHKGQVIVPDGDFYLCPLHQNLINQHRLTAGVKLLSELPRGMHPIHFDRRLPLQCTHEDAVEIAKYDCDFLPGTDGYSAFIQAATGRGGE